MTLTIDKDVPFPGTLGDQRQDFAEKMSIGDSIFTENRSEAAAVENALRKTSDGSPARRVEGDGWRIWKIEKRAPRKRKALGLLAKTPTKRAAKKTTRKAPTRKMPRSMPAEGTN